MHVRNIRISGFHNHVNTELQFPNKGVLVITGANGSGKSTVIDAVSWVLWGRTLRGVAPGGNGDTTCLVELVTDTFVATRERRNKKTKFRIEFEDAQRQS